MLKGLDARVDGMINAASGLYASNAVALQHAVEGSEKGLAAAAAAKDAYLQRIESALGLLKVWERCCPVLIFASPKQDSILAVVHHSAADYIRCCVCCCVKMYLI